MAASQGEHRSDPRVLCLGEVLYDFLADQPDRAFADVESWTPYPGGAPANVACALVKLGTTAGFIGCVGSDPTGDRLVNLLQMTQVDMTGVQRHPHAPTRTVYVTHSQTGDRQFAGFGGYDTREFADAHLQADAVPESLFETADYLVLGTLELAYSATRTAIQRALNLAQKHRVKVLVDINWRPVFWPNPKVAQQSILEMLSQIDFLKLAHEEALWLFGTADPDVIRQHVPHVIGVLVTNGEYGCTYNLAGQGGQVQGLSVSVVDTTGAGDAFVAGFLHQLCQQGCHSYQTPEGARAMMRYANVVGALTTTKPGAIAGQPLPKDINAVLHTFP